MVELENILQESEEKYKLLINSILDVIAEVELDGAFSFISPRVYNIFGYKPNEVIGKQFFSYIHVDDMDKVMKTFEKIVIGEEIVLFATSFAS